MSYEYPTEEALQRIRDWSYVDFLDWFAFIRESWWSPDWGWHESDGEDELYKRPVRVFDISTGGWSGNEEIIAAMRENFICWSETWVSHRRGGHFVFYVPMGVPAAQEMQP